MFDYPLAADSFADEEIHSAIEVLKSRQYTMGPRVLEFEKQLASWLGVKNAVMVNSGSSANLILIESLIRRSTQDAPLKPGDEVLVPALAWPTTVWPLVQLGLVPVFVDINPQTLALDLDRAQAALSPKTRAIFMIHVLGRAAPVADFKKFCEQNGLVFLEDCCESFGAFSNERHVGTEGWGGTLSHFFSHHLTTIEGGTVITNDSALADDLRSLRAHGWTRNREDREAWHAKYSHLDPRFLFIMTGYNVRPTELQAAIGIVQLKKMESALQKRTEFAHQVFSLTQKIEGLELIGAETLKKDMSIRHYRERSHSWMNLPFRLLQSRRWSRERVIKTLESAGVETRPIIAGNLTKHPAIAGIPHRIGGSLEVADQLLEQGFMLGCHPTQADRNLAVLQKAFARLGDL